MEFPPEVDFIGPIRRFDKTGTCAFGARANDRPGETKLRDQLGCEKKREWPWLTRRCWRQSGAGSANGNDRGCGPAISSRRDDGVLRPLRRRPDSRATEAVSMAPGRKSVSDHPI